MRKSGYKDNLARSSGADLNTQGNKAQVKHRTDRQEKENRETRESK